VWPAGQLDELSGRPAAPRPRRGVVVRVRGSAAPHRPCHARSPSFLSVTAGRRPACPRKRAATSRPSGGPSMDVMTPASPGPVEGRRSSTGLSPPRPPQRRRHARRDVSCRRGPRSIRRESVGHGRPALVRSGAAQAGWPRAATHPVREWEPVLDVPP